MCLPFPSAVVITRSIQRLGHADAEIGIGAAPSRTGGLEFDPYLSRPSSIPIPSTCGRRVTGDSQPHTNYTHLTHIVATPRDRVQASPTPPKTRPNKTDSPDTDVAPTVCPARLALTDTGPSANKRFRMGHQQNSPIRLHVYRLSTQSGPCSPSVSICAPFPILFLATSALTRPLTHTLTHTLTHSHTHTLTHTRLSPPFQGPAPWSPLRCPTPGGTQAPVSKFQIPTTHRAAITRIHRFMAPG